MLGMVVEEDQEELHPLVHTVLLLVVMEVILITHMKVDMVETPVVETLICQGAVVKCPTDLTEKVDLDVVSGIKQDQTTITVALTLRTPMDNGVLVEVMDIILKTVMHTTTVVVVQVV